MLHSKKNLAETIAFKVVNERIQWQQQMNEYNGNNKFYITKHSFNS